MAFTIDGIVIDRIQLGVAEDFSGNPLYTLTQLSDGTIDITAEGKEAKSAEGTLIKKFWQGKAGTFTANNAMLDFNILGEASGSGKQVASNDAPIQMPKIMLVDGNITKIKLANTDKGEEIVDGTIRVNAVAANGTMGVEKYTLDTAATADKFAFDKTSGELTLPTPDKKPAQYMIKFERKVKSGVMVQNKANEFPGTIRLTLKALAVDPCTADTVRACYIYLPSFQVSPETSISMTTDATFEFKGDLQVDYCSKDKQLYVIYMADEEE